MTYTWTTPPCPYFGACGGCSLQHLETSAYETHKLNFLQTKLTEFGITTPLDPLVRLNPGLRRRVSFKVQHHKIGFYAPESHRLVPIDSCLLLTPHLNELLTTVPAALKKCPELPPKFALTALEAENGIDLLFEDVNLADLGYETRENLASLLQHPHITRIRTKAKSKVELISEKKAPYLIYAGYHVPVSAGDFCQVARETDAFFAEHITRHAELVSASRSRNKFGMTDDVKQADFFSGRGTLSFPLLTAGPVDAYEMDETAIATLKRLAQQYKLPLSAHQRQLFKEPLSVEECNNYQRIVINPPREGAIHQARNLALSSVSNLIYVSCNPATFARDASILIKGGYKLNKMVPFDQFIWSNHLEVIGFFEKAT